MKRAAICVAGLLALAGALCAQKTPNFSVRNDEIFNGEITDNICAEGHHIDAIKSEQNCILTCVKFEGAQFVLYNSDTKRIYELDDQKQPEPFAGQEVTVTGRYDKDARVIHVIRIRLKITDAGL